ncbi:hypothetical protein KU6B_47420 [Mameliella alba]|uniref:P-loop ATPase, Sll1717 family n=1 Tax=Mameliella alba TaxID=561184 RepID=UPI0013E41289|nr:hypothetical protein [Mameliella alba]BBU58477.1 hypothetical protein KU6B_47420 [Mameliella alba]
MKNFSNIEFGEISGETEREKNPDLIEKGFVDLGSVEQEALDGDRFLILGYKGSGKSSIGERLDLSQKNRHDRFVKKISLADFPFTPFSKIVKGDIEPEAKFPTAWSWILIVYIMESFGRDAAMHHPNINEFQGALDSFKELGVSPNASPASIAHASSKNSFSIKLPFNILEYTRDGGNRKQPDDIFNFVASLKEFVTQVRSPNKHLLVIDGLDDILSTRGIQYKSLYALMQETHDLNPLLSKHHVPFKIIILCRTDLFDRAPGPNKNKIRTPYAIDLDWYHDPNDPGNSMLVRGANLRAGLSLKRDVDIFSEFLPKQTHGLPTRQYLLDMTRHTPRDFFQLLSCIQKYQKSGKMKESEVKSGLRDYSLKYFQPEIQDELSGYANVNEISAFFSSISVVGKRDFSFKELKEAWIGEGGDEGGEALVAMCKATFDCSAIGNITDSKGYTHYSFKYRNRLSSFSQSKRIMVHRGLWKAVNL